MDNAVALAAIGLVASILAIVVKPLFAMLREFTKSLKENTHATNALVAETKKGNKEAKERNGHLAELILQQGEQTKMIAETSTDRVIDAMQHVEQQSVEHQTIKEVSHVPNRDKASE